ncbi:DeoR/GlpR transcriptional regulator [bacterium]|nr:MAG: DeoR/GlpR transcriptional regulator [bacterium]
MNPQKDAKNRTILPEERRRIILDTLKRDGKVLSSELALELATSEDTVRRDLKELEDAGLLQRVHGGALPQTPVPHEYKERSRRDTIAKEAIGKAAATLVGPTDTVLLDGGTTILQVARALPPSFRGTVITSNLNAVLALAEHPEADVIVLGGKLHKPILGCIGSQVANEIAKVQADICFMGATSLDPTSGLASLDYEEAHIKRAMVAASSRVVAVLSSEKLGTASPFLFASMEELDYLVTGKSAPAEVVEQCRLLGVEVLQG